MMLNQQNCFPMNIPVFCLQLTELDTKIDQTSQIYTLLWLMPPQELKLLLFSTCCPQYQVNQFPIFFPFFDASRNLDPSIPLTAE